MKKNIFIMNTTMDIGGVETALLSLLREFDYEKYNVDLFLLKHEGSQLKAIPSNVNVLPEIAGYSALVGPIVNQLKKKQFGIVFGRIVAKFASKMYCKLNRHKSDTMVPFIYSNKFTRIFLPKITKKYYDLAISFQTPHYFVSEKVNAKKKIAWIHTDYSFYDTDIKAEYKMWNEYDHIISISDDVTKSFLSKFPKLASKIVLIENILSSNTIMSKAQEFSVETEIESKCISLLSIGRFANAKNFDNVPEIASIIKSKGIGFKWYIIGFGSDEQLIRNKITEYNMEETVIILGKKENPYPYIKACDYYVQPSRFEGKSVTVREAQILKKAVIITNYLTSSSQVKNGVDGIIVPLDNNSCADAIASILMNEQLKNNLISYLSNTSYSNENEVNKLYKLID